MYSNKRLLIASAIVGLLGLGVITSSVMAATGASSPKYSPLVQKIADAFHLNPADVQKVVNQEKQDRAINREQKIKSHLDQLVKNGTITQDQEDKIVAELKQLKQQLKSGNHQDRLQNNQNLRAQIQQWLDDNGINVDLDQLLPPRPASRQDDHGAER